MSPHACTADLELLLPQRELRALLWALVFCSLLSAVVAVARSGIPSSALCEIHGNAFVEQCSECDRVFQHDAMVVSPAMHERLSTAETHKRWLARDCKSAGRVQKLREAHRQQKKGDPLNGKYTGRICPHPKCAAPLVASVIEFGESLYNDDLKKSQEAIKKVSQDQSRRAAEMSVREPEDRVAIAVALLA